MKKCETFNDANIIEAGKPYLYDLQGRKVSRPAKGVYIVNGRKVVMR